MAKLKIVNVQLWEDKTKVKKLPFCKFLFLAARERVEAQAEAIAAFI
ncbi:MAG: hypothetical protein ACHBN1_38010 [Heteroscytonema crispum UTEX LB 1556]